MLEVINKNSCTEPQSISNIHDLESLVLIDKLIGKYNNKEISYVTNNRGEKVPSLPRIFFNIKRIGVTCFIDYIYNGDSQMS